MGHGRTELGEWPARWGPTNLYGTIGRDERPMKTMMAYLPLDLQALGRWAGRRGLLRRGVFDEGYALHILLSSVFGRGCLQPFRVFRPSRGRMGTLYAYSGMDQEALRELAAVTAPPDCLEPIGLDSLLTKLMPARLETGQRLGFDVRVRPVRRLGRDLEDSQSKSVLRKGSEIDAFRVELLHRSPNGWRDRKSEETAGIRREQVYTTWLAERLAGAADIDLASCRLAAFRRSRTIRGNGLGPEGPDAVLHGECVIGDADEFSDRLRRGIGRHRAYGYGMLIARPPNTAARNR